MECCAEFFEFGDSREAVCVDGKGGGPDGGRSWDRLVFDDAFFDALVVCGGEGIDVWGCGGWWVHVFEGGVVDGVVCSSAIFLTIGEGIFVGF